MSRQGCALGDPERAIAVGAVRGWRRSGQAAKGSQLDVSSPPAGHRHVRDD